LSSVDNRIVNMQFNNTRFQKNAKDTISVLDKLKKGLNLDSATRSLENLKKTGDSFSLAGIAKGVDSIAGKFSTLGIVGVTALQNITNAAIQTGTRLFKSLTLDPIMSGFTEYETKMGSITTILTNTASKGTTLEEVNAALAELNTYADQTIYNFAEMTRNIGTFTAAGLDLETSVNAIKGIANLAAGSGSSAVQASTAMYQLSQALAAGRVSLQDWNSVVNAGMGGELFQNALKETAKQMGIFVDETKPFRETLRDGWLTSDVLSTTLGKFAEDESLVKAATQVRTLTQLLDTLGESVQSGWATTWEIIIGDSEQAAELFTGLSDAIGGFFGKFSDSRNAVLTGALTSNWDKMVSKIKEAGFSADTFNEKIRETAESQGIDLDKIVEEYGSVEKAFQKGALSSDILKTALSDLGSTMLDIDGILKRGSGFTEGTEDVKKLQEALQAAGYELTQFGVDGKYGKETEEAVKAFQEAKGLIADGIVGPDTIAALNEANKSTEQLSDRVLELVDQVTVMSGRELLIDSFAKAFSNLGKIFGSIKDAWDNVFPPKTIEERSKNLYNLIQSFHNFAESLKPSETLLNHLERTFTGLFSLFNIGLKGVNAFVRGITSLIGIVVPAGTGIFGLTAFIGDFITTLDKGLSVFNVFEGGVTLIIGAFRILGNVVKGVFSGVNYLLDLLSGKITIPALDAIDSFSSSLSNMKKTASDAFNGVRDSAKDGLGAANSILDNFSRGIENVKNLLLGLGSKIKTALAPVVNQIKEAFGGVTITDAIGTGLLAGIALFVRNLVKNMKKVTKSFDDVVSGIVDVLDSARGALETWQKSIRANTLIKIAGAVAILAAALIALSFVDSAKLRDGLIGVSVLLAEVLVTMELLNRFKVQGIAGAATSMVIMAGAVSVLASALLKLKEFQSWDETWPALLSMGVLLAGLTASTKVLSKNVNGAELIKTSIGLVIFAEAIKKLAKAMETFSQLETSQIGKGLLSLAGLLAEIAVFIRLARIDQLKSSQGTILAIATAMLALYASVALFGKMDTGNLTKGLVSVGTLIAGLTVSLRLLGDVQLSGIATSMLGIATSLSVLIIPIKLLGGMNLGELAKGLVSIGVALTGMSTVLIALGAAQKTLGKATGAGASLIALATALTILIIPIEVLGHTKWQALALGIGSLIVVLAALGATAAVLAPLGTTLLTVAAAFGIFGIAAVGVGAGMLAVSTGLATLAVSGAAGAAVLVTALSGIISLIPSFMKSIGLGVVAFASAIEQGAPAIGSAFEAIIIASMDALQATVPAIGDTIFILLDHVLATLEKYTPKFATSIFNILIGVLDILEKNLPILVEKAANIISTFLQSIFSVFGEFSSENLVKAVASIGALVACFALLAGAANLAKKAIVGTLAMVVVMAALTAVFVALGSLPVEKTTGIAEGLSSLLIALSASMVLISLVPVAGALTGIAGLAIVVAGLTAILAALGGLSQIPGFDWLMGEGTKVLGMIGTAIGSFFGNIAGGFVTGITGKFPQIGTDLSNFMKNAEPFFSGISNVNQNAVSGVKALAQTVLILTAADILNGLTSWLTGGSSMIDFGKQIADFAPYFQKYYESIKGIDPSVVEASGNAAKSLAEFANNIPNQGGVAAFFAGENSLVEFANQLSEFGPKLKRYADSVQGLDANVVTNSANAAKALSEMAANLPNQGGVVSWFTGDNTLSAFAKELVQFGPRLKAYAVSVQGLDAGVVVNSANAAKALSELASNLPNTGGLVSLFTGDNSIASFGDDLAKFGGYLSNYYESISGISFPQLSLAIAEVNKLIDLTGRMADTDTSVLGSFGQSLTRLGNSGVEGFISAFTNSVGKVKQVATNLTKSAEQGIKSNQLIFGQTGTKYGNDFARNLSNRQTSAKVSGRSVSIAAEQGIKSNQLIFGQTGTTYGNNFANHLSATSSAARTAAVQVVSSAISGISSKIGEFENAGRNAGQGFINGIRSKAGEAADAAASVVREALAAADRALDAHSPSKEFETRGVWSIQGLILGFLSQAGKLYSTVHDVGKTAVNTMGFALEEAYEYANSNMDFEPTITPVLDLSKVRSGVGLVNGLFAGTTLNAVTSLNGARVISSGMKNQTNYETPETASSAKGDTYNIFNQTNNSPKALSRLDIYRQTKNLFALAKGPVNYR